VGFLLAAFSAISNDSIQTVGTFFSCTRDMHWSIL
jgi:hypothetical protein